MALVEPGLFHRLALAVEDAGATDAWFRRVLGAAPVTAPERPFQDEPVGGVLELDGADSRMVWLGGLPFIFLGAATPDGPVGRFIQRWGPSVHSLAWEIEDMWTVEHVLDQAGYHITGVNIPGRHFFMHPRDTDGVLLEWTDTSIGGDPRRGNPDPGEGGGVVDVTGIAWVTAVVADADATAARLTEMAAATPVTGNPTGDQAAERTIDLAVHDVTVRLVTPRSDASRFHPVLERAPRLWSYTARVPDLDAALAALESDGIKTLGRQGAVAWTDPATTLGVPMEWTDA
jgi:catechol 2,3-dioxygenase-like lactoylglutathione lyase family enzyme